MAGAVQSTEILCLLNMVIPEELEDEEFYSVAEDIRCECSKHGTVKSLEIPRPVDGIEVPGIGKVFVEFTTISDCQQAREALNGRMYGGRAITATFFDPNKYHRKEF